jgi:hypothetical protein
VRDNTREKRGASERVRKEKGEERERIGEERPTEFEVRVK